MSEDKKQDVKQLLMQDYTDILKQYEENPIDQPLTFRPERVAYIGGEQSVVASEPVLPLKNDQKKCPSDSVIF